MRLIKFLGASMVLKIVLFMGRKGQTGLKITSAKTLVPKMVVNVAG